MPPHQRHFSQQVPQGMQGQGFADDPSKRLAPKAQGLLSKITDDIRALNSSVLIISQKINYLVRNEKILGRNLLVLNKKIRALQEGGLAPGSGITGSAAPPADISARLAGIEAELESIRQNYAKAEAVAEMKYVVDSINPLEFATLADLEEATGKKVAHGKKKK